MHPLITAYYNLKRWRDLGIRRESPYYSVWQREINELLDLIHELK